MAGVVPMQQSACYRSDVASMIMSRRVRKKISGTPPSNGLTRMIYQACGNLRVSCFLLYAEARVYPYDPTTRRCCTTSRWKHAFEE